MEDLKTQNKESRENRLGKIRPRIFKSENQKSSSKKSEECPPKKQKLNKFFNKVECTVQTQKERNSETEHQRVSQAKINTGKCIRFARKDGFCERQQGKRLIFAIVDRRRCRKYGYHYNLHQCRVNESTIGFIKLLQLRPSIDNLTAHLEEKS